MVSPYGLLHSDLNVPINHIVLLMLWWVYKVRLPYCVPWYKTVLRVVCGYISSISVHVTVYNEK